jgi:hypothetical protein
MYRFIVGPTHCLSPVYWEEWTIKYEMTIDQWYEQMKRVIQSDKEYGYETIFDLTPDHLSNDYVSIYRAATYDFRHAYFPEEGLVCSPEHCSPYNKSFVITNHLTC